MTGIADSWWLVPLTMALVCGLTCPLLGTVLVVQQQVMNTNLMAYAVLPGLVIGQALNLDPVVGGLLSALATVALIEPWLDAHHASGRNSDAVRNTALAGCLGLGVLLIQLFDVRLELDALLFGDLLTATSSDLCWLVLSAVVLLGLLRWRFTDLQWLGLDPEAAAERELPIRRLRLAMAVATAMVVVTATAAVGLALVMALICGPALLGLHHARSLTQALTRAAFVGTGVSMGGCGLALGLNQPPGPLMALLACCCLPVLAWQRH